MRVFLALAAYYIVAVRESAVPMAHLTRAAFLSIPGEDIDGLELRRGDTVVTNGGLIGKVTKVIDDDQIEIEIADDVRIRQMRQMVTDVRAKGEPVKDEAAAG